MLAGMEAHARLTWLVKPYNSALGNPAVAFYTARVNRWLFSQTVSFLKSCNLYLPNQFSVVSSQSSDWTSVATSRFSAND